MSDLVLPVERARNSASLLSTVGAALAGFGLGALVAGAVADFAELLLGVGLVGHLVGMVGNRRLQIVRDYRPATWEQVAFWGCWAAVDALLAWILVRLAG